ncbi:lipoprotein insertase outer membrane protein LolB, partial [Psychrobacter sp. SIMBA_152]
DRCLNPALPADEGNQPPLHQKFSTVITAVCPGLLEWRAHPLKGQLAKLTVDDSGALLTDSDDQERWAPSADALLYRLLGAAVPFEE